MARCAVFASGAGSNFEKLQQVLAEVPAHDLVCLVTDKPKAPVTLKALACGIPVIPIVYTRTHEGKLDRRSAERGVIAHLRRYQVDCIVLAGFMRLLSPELLQAYPQRIVNIHPSLLPKYPGTQGIRDSIASPDAELGITIHLVDEGMDTGPILEQRSFQRVPGQTPAHEESRIHSLEHAAYPEVVIDFLNKTQEHNA